MSDQNSKWTDDRIEHCAMLVRHAWRLHGPGGAFYTASTSVLPPDFDIELLREPLARMGVPMPQEPVEDPRYRGLAQISDC
jgi:hypothetical protein